MPQMAPKKKVNPNSPPDEEDPEPDLGITNISDEIDSSCSE
jgi:hypothetical protein